MDPANFARGAAVLDDSMSEWPKPEPLYRAPLPPDPFPLDALGKYAGTARAIQKIIQAPSAICGQAVLAGLALAAQSHADILIDGRRRPTSCYFASVGETGERKSAVDDVAKRPHAQFERAMEATYREEYAAYQMELVAWKQATEAEVKRQKTKKAKLQAMREAGEEPVKPLAPALLVEEPTYEGLIKVLQEGFPSLGLFTDEGGRFIGGHAMNHDNALKTAAGLSSLWDRGEAKRTRSGDGHSAIYGKRVSMHLMFQGKVAEMLLGNDIFREQGLLSRMLISWPASTVGSRPYVEENIFESPEVRIYHEDCLRLLESTHLTSDRILDPAPLSLSRNAKAIWIRFHDYCDLQSAAGGEVETVRGLANKAPEHAARLAGILAVTRGGTEISAADIEAGICLANFYMGEAVRIADAGQVSPEIKDAERLLNWLREKGFDQVTAAKVYQYGPGRRLRTRDAALNALDILARHNLVIPFEVDGRQLWRVAPDV